MLISGDSEPFRRLSESYNFKAASSAIIIKRTQSDAGFRMIKTYSYPEYQDSFRSFISWRKIGGRFRKKNVLMVEQSGDYLEECLECTQKSLDNFLAESGLKMEQIDLIIPSQSPHGYCDGLSSLLNVRDKIIKVNSMGRLELHTAGPAYALKQVWDNRGFERSSNVLFLSVGSGICNTIAWYVND
jgi:3-oxoacyl-[acyl-carrier-protein] synthase III